MFKLSEEQQKQIQNAIDTEIAKFLENLPSMIQKDLRSAALSVIGLTDRWGKMEVDCNSKGQKIIKDLIERTVKEETEKNLEEIVREEVLEFINSEDAIKLRKVVIKSIAVDYRDDVRRAANRLYADHVKNFAEGFINGLSAAVSDKDFGPQNQDIEDPNSFEGPLGPIFLQELINSIKSNGEG